MSLSAPRPSARNRSGPSRRLSLSALALTVFAMAAAPALAQPAAAPQRQISIQGEGTATAAPNEAVIGSGTQVQARTAREAMDGNARAMRQVQEALKQAGIAERDVTTSALTLRPVVDYAAGNRPRVTGYTAGHRLEVRIRDLAQLGDVLDRMVAAGANQIDGLDLTVSNWSAKVDEARIAAVADARRKAEALAAAAGARLGKVLTITEHGGAVPPPAMRSSAARTLSASGPTPVATGDQTFRLTVAVVWELVD